jgi:hypothetical protein
LTDIPVEPGRQVALSYPLSPSALKVPPFATLTFWWEIQDESGNLNQTEEQLLYYADNRYPWQSLRDQQEDVSWDVYWVDGGASIGEITLDIAVEALDEISRELRSTIPGSVHIFVYPSEAELRTALNLAGYEWAGGQARPELGAILVGVSDGPTARGELERLIPHELTHLMVYEATGQTLNRVPAWLNEGLATLNEGRPDPERQALVEQALADNSLFPLDALCAPFPSDQNDARLAYAQSASVVSYLQEEYGNQTIRDLLAAYADGASCEAGITKTLRKSINGLDSAWRASLTRRGEIFVALSDSAMWLALWLLTALLVLPLLGALRARNAQEEVG